MDDDRGSAAYLDGADADRHGSKPSVRFDRPVYFAFDVLLVTGTRVPAVSYPSDPETDVRRPVVRLDAGEVTGPVRRR